MPADVGRDRIVEKRGGLAAAGDAGVVRVPDPGGGEETDGTVSPPQGHEWNAPVSWIGMKAAPNELLYLFIVPDWRS